ncbi:MAG: SDR family oxidoreductase [Rhodobacteraceae bacterium]|nr:SDR family oxidoreductase [Paracoccaceae bacterium]
MTGPEDAGLTLAGKVLLITGATQGLGAEIAREAARRGAQAIALAGRSVENGAAVAAEMRALGTDARHFPADLSAPEAPQTLVAAVLDWQGRVDGLVNAAGLTDRAGCVDGTLADWDRLFALNARAPFFMMQGVIRAALAAGHPASIVNILSMNAHCGGPDLAIYAATKGALATLTRNAAHAHMADRIRVNGINMGWAATDAERDMQARRLGKGADWEARAAAGMPLGRLLRADEVARLTVYLLSDYAGLQTGTLIDLEQRVLGAPGDPPA